MVISSHSDAPEIERCSWLEYLVGGFLHSEQVVGELVTLLGSIFLFFWTASLLRHPHYLTIALTTLCLLLFLTIYKA